MTETNIEKSIHDAVSDCLTGLDHLPSQENEIIQRARERKAMEISYQKYGNQPAIQNRKIAVNPAKQVSFRIVLATISVLALVVNVLAINNPSFLSNLFQPMDTVSTQPSESLESPGETPDSAFAGTIYQKAGNEYEYTILNDDTIEITRYLGVDQETVIIPDTIDGYHVSSIGKLSFNHCYSIKSISIPDGVTNIGTYAFSNCTSLNTVTIPDTVTLIDCFAFEYCSSLTEMWIPDSVEAIGAQAFYYCSSLNNIRLPEKITVLYYGLFAHCRSLKTVLIPEFVTEVCDSAFAFCESLSDVHLPLGLKKIGNYAFGKCTELKTMTIPKSVEVIDRYAFLDCEKLHFIVTENSYAAGYCEENGMHFKMLPEVKDRIPNSSISLSNL